VAYFSIFEYFINCIILNALKSRWSFLFMTIVFMSTYLTVNAQGQNCKLVLSGNVIDASNNAPLEKAVVEIKELGLKFVTDVKGQYHFYDLCAGNYTIVVNHISCDSVVLKTAVQRNQIKNFRLPHSFNQLETVSVRSKKDLMVNTIREELSAKAIEKTRGQSLGEILKQVNGVAVLQTGSTIFKPVIHGLHSQRILLVNNGVRLESQQWGTDHAPEIDPFIADKFTVLKGAGALRYGSDAIAGAVLIEPKPLLKQAGKNAEFNSTYFSNNRQYVFNGMYEASPLNLPEFSYRIQATYKKGGNARTPDYWLYNTGLEEFNYSATAGYRKNRFNTELFFSSFQTALGIFMGAHVGNLTDLQNAIQSKKPIQNIDQFSYEILRPRQSVQHTTVKSKSQYLLLNDHKINLILSYQSNVRQEYDRALLSPRPELDLNITTTLVDLNYESASSKKRQYAFGTNAMLQENVWTGSRFFIPNFRVQNIALYATQSLNLNDWMLDGGLRYDFKSLTTFRNQNDALSSIERTFGNASGTLGATYKITPNLRWLINSAFAWRAPQVNELYVNGLHHGTASFEIGNPDLKSEKALNFSTQLKYQSDSSWQVDLTLYNNIINDFINMNPSTPATLTLRGAYPTFKFIQTNALLRGLDLSVQKTINAHLSTSAKTALLWATDRKTNDWLIQMPANRVEGEFTYSFNSDILKNAAVELRLLHMMQQTRIPKNIPDYLPPPAAYNLLNLDFNADVMLGKQTINLGLAVLNVLNERYRDYMNRFRYFNDEPGRSINVRCKIKL
jgi:iron complex outermembrane receptor protein